jgi:hypothetical protein
MPTSRDDPLLLNTADKERHRRLAAHSTRRQRPLLLPQHHMPVESFFG